MRDMNVSIARLLVTGLLTGAGLMSASLPAVAGTEAEVTFHGTLIEAPPCVVNDGNPVVVDFGSEVMTTRIDGTEYRKRIDFTLDCSASAPGMQQLRISGGPVTDFDPQALAGGQIGFGVALYDRSQRYAPGTWLPLADPGIPELYAVPVKEDGVKLNGGAFSIMASLVVAYQ